MKKTFFILAVFIAVVSLHPFAIAEQTLSNEQIVAEENYVASSILEQGAGDRLVIKGIYAQEGPPCAGTISSKLGGKALIFSLEMPRDGFESLDAKPLLLGNKSIHRFAGEVRLGGGLGGEGLPTVIGEGGKGDRLTFVLLEGVGYVYLRGKGKVVYPDGKIVKLGKSETPVNPEIDDGLPGVIISVMLGENWTTF